MRGTCVVEIEIARAVTESDEDEVGDSAEASTRNCDAVFVGAVDEWSTAAAELADQLFRNRMQKELSNGSNGNGLSFLSQFSNVVSIHFFIV